LDDADTNLKSNLIGDDSAAFSLSEQSLSKWLMFSAATAIVLISESYLWFLPSGPHLGDSFLQTVQGAIHTTDPSVTILAMLTFFAVVHSGLANLRPSAEDIIGARAWRVIFACASLPLALSCISYFINHSHEGAVLWNLHNVPGLHSFCWILNFISFIFLYPSSFNLLEIAAVDEPQLHLWETGIIRITRHPQAVGQIMWCTAHTLWLGTSVTLCASSVLVLHHVFSMWNGDRRLRNKHGQEFEIIKERTSLVPFAAILDGRQVLPERYLDEFLRGPYGLVVGGTLLAYLAHPFMMSGAALLHW